ncbi:hypothetical protein EDC96DRAFT_522552 [Choanephora cucurbitarum]|nr:hypothetical protein EDC96DRAFT_522552 [Choanephora cucurbitarum]
MCRKVTCPDCKKFTWAGCGLHIDQALAGLKDEEICKCKESKQKAEEIPDLIKLV